MSRPLIFITNDDGIHAPGIKYLAEAMSELGDIVIVAPDKGMSGMSHALTVSNILRITPVSYHNGYEAYSCNGTPVDCLKLARHKILTRKPDLVVSGINHGSNASINVIYSGTMAVAIEGAIQGISSIGFSLLDFSTNADFSAAQIYAKQIASEILSNPMDRGTCLNVNIPIAKHEDIKGIKICRQALGDWNDEYIEKSDPLGKSYFWLTGEFVNHDITEDTDEWALKHNYVSVVPIHIDYTNHAAIPKFKTLENAKIQ